MKKNKLVNNSECGLKLRVLVAALVLACAATQSANAQNLTAQGLDQRIQRLERVLDNSVLINMVQRIDALQQEVRQLRGQIEQKTNEIEAMRERERKLYLDTDQRLQDLEQGNPDGGGSFSEFAQQEPAEPEPVEQIVQSSPSPADSRQEKLEYQNAYDLLILGRNNEAIAEFETFLDQYPAGAYADNAHYWLGEANYVERRYDEAIDRFNVVIYQFPVSRKLPDARLRKGFALFELQRYQEARDELQQVESEYRGRSIAALARRRIEQMDNAGL